MFEQEELTEEERERFRELSRHAKGDILTMTTLAGSGHPGGSISSLDIYLVVFAFANLTKKPRDRIVVSHGHTSPGVYSALARLGHLPVDDVIAFFRKAGSPYEGHVVKGIPFIDWSTGNLGQGLSAGCGFALASKVRREPFHVYVLMSDGEQQKGQVSEARRFAKKYGLSNITVVMDYNGIQISGKTSDVMPQMVIENFLSDGWDVLEINAHDHNEIYKALKKAHEIDNPVCIVGHTIMGNGISFMENREKYHGSPLNASEYADALKILGLENRLLHYKEKRKGQWQWTPSNKTNTTVIESGTPFTYSDEDMIDNRTAFGRALKDLGEKNIPTGRFVCAFDCDLASSVKTNEFAKAFPDYFFQGGIQEHNTATISGALSTTGILTFFADFGVFGIDETYNQHRLNDINKTNLKLILTHLGLDVGQDGKTHQCIDYIGLANNLYHFRTIIPCDPNQTDRVIRYIAREEGNFLVGMGRSRWPVICDEKNKPLFADGYQFQYGKMDIIRHGNDGALITYGGMVHRAIKIREKVMEKGITLKVINMACVQEIDEAVLQDILKLPFIITYEDHNPRTGIAPLIATYLLNNEYRGRMESYGVTDYGQSGETEEILKREGLDIESMVNVLSNITKI